MFKNRSILKRNFSFYEKFVDYFMVRENQHIRLVDTSIKRFPSPFEESIPKLGVREVKMTKLPNGVRVISETPSLPGTVSMGIMLEVGSRDENHENSGSLFSIYSTYYKSHVNTNETINFGMMQMTGGKYEMNFDRERSLFKATCLSYDVSDVFSMMSDCVLEPRSSIAVNVAMVKMKYLHKLNAAKYPGLADTELFLHEIYNHEGLGNPMYGNQKNIDNLNGFLLQKFQIENYSPEKIIIGGVGVQNHGEFVNLVDEYFGKINFASKQAIREKSVFNEIDLRTANSQLNKNNIYITYESVPLNHPDFVKAYLATELFGSADVSNPNSVECNYGLFVNEIYKKEKSVFATQAFNMNFTDSGLFGFRISAQADSSNKAIDILAELIKSIHKLTDEDILFAKKRLARKIIEATENDFQRVGEFLNHQSSFGDVQLYSLIQQIQKITAQELFKFIQTTLSNKMSVFVHGSSPLSVYKAEKIKEVLK